MGARARYLIHNSHADTRHSMSSEQQQPASPSRKGFFGLGKKDGAKTPRHEVAQTPILEHGNPLEKANIPTEARNQQIVGVAGTDVEGDHSKILLALDGTDAGDKAFKYLLQSKVLSKEAHVFVATVLPAQVLSGPWVAGPLVRCSASSLSAVFLFY